MSLTLHQVRTHEQPVEGCFGCRAASISFNLSPAFTAVEKSERKLSKDLAAYKRLRGDGVQPASIRGAADLESKAEHKLDVDVAGTSNPFVKQMSNRQKDSYTEANAAITPTAAD